MNDEKEPRTGATPEQLANAIESRLRWVCAVDDTSGVTGYTRQQYTSQVNNVAPHLVPPGMVIAAASDVLTPERKALIGRAATCAELLRAMTFTTYSESERRNVFTAAFDAASAVTDADLATLREMAS